ncbi:MAG: DUF1844 domain-containing protein [Candidatus Eisenbacteria bacterium]
MPEKELNPYLHHLIAQYEFFGLIWLGKVPDPSTGKAHRELPQVREVIQFLEMLEMKTRGNLNPDEQQELRRVLTLLRLNYVEEMRRPEPAGGSSAMAAEPSPQHAAPGASAAAAEGTPAAPVEEGPTSEPESRRQQ